MDLAAAYVDTIQTTVYCYGLKTTLDIGAGAPGTR